jgi:hypothetical protein
MKRVILTGADEASYRTANRRSSRLMAFPDGMPRCITLTAWQWQVFDWLEESGRYAEGEIAQRSYASAMRWCPESVLQVVRPTGWQHLPVPAFNEAARPKPVAPAVLAFRENAENITRYAHRFFEQTLRKHIALKLSIWMYDRMGFQFEHAANDPTEYGPIPCFTASPVHE